MSSRVTRSQTRNGIPSLKKEDHNESELAERESKLSGSIAKFYTKKAQLEAREAELNAREAELNAREAELAAREAELDARQRKLAARERKLAATEKQARKEELSKKLKGGKKLTDLELFEEGSTPHHELRLYGTHYYDCKSNCHSCGGSGWVCGERGAGGYGNEERRCQSGRWIPLTKKQIKEFWDNDD